MSSRKSLIKINLDKEDVFLMSQYDSESNLRLQILNVRRNEAYDGQVSDVDLRTQAAVIRLTFYDFMQRITNALFDRTTDSFNFRYSLDEKDGNFVFKWKSIDHEETVINLGHVNMNKRDAVFVFTEVLQSMSEEMKTLNSKMLKMSTELEESKNNTSETTNQLVWALDAKESLEKELYSKFVLVLNEKKRRIKELMHKSCSDSEKNQTKNKKTKIVHPLSSDSSDIDGDLDFNQPGPSNAIGRNSLPFLEDNKPFVSAAQNKIRNRKVQVSKNSELAIKIAAKNSLSSAPIIDEEDDSDDLLKCL